MIANTYRETRLEPGRDRALSRSSRILARTAAAIDAVLLIAAFFLAQRIRIAILGPFKSPWQWHEHALMVELTIVTWVLSGSYLGLYAGRRRPLGRELTPLAWTALLTAVVLGSLAFLLKLTYLSRPLALIYISTGYVAASAFRLVGRIPSSDTATSGRRAIVVGSGPQAEEICRHIEHSGAKLLGVISEDPNAWVPLTRRKLGAIEDCEEILRREVVDQVIFAVPKLKLFAVEHAFSIAEDLGLETKLCLNFLPHRFAKIDYEELGGMPTLAFTSAPAHPVQLALKRLFDITISLFALILGAPVFATIALIIKLTSHGPVFFGQTRSGLNGREFRVWKFRSMVVDAEARLKDLQHQNEMTGPVFKMKRDPRVTSIGQFLRKTSLDELPQFWNVLLGQMSIVGPRPPIPAEVEKYARWQRRRLSVKPGITCTWQISGRNNIDFETWMRLDLDYIDRWSLWLDFIIFIKTVPAVLLRRGAA